MSKTWKIILIILAVLILIVVLGKAFGGNSDVKKVFSEAVAKRSVTEQVTASGKIQPMTEVKIQSEVSGQIIELPVKEGDVVTKGQLLVKINPDIYLSSLNQADASLNSARSSLASAKARLLQSEAQLKMAELSYNRTKKLFAEGAVSQSELDNATSTFETSQADAAAAKENIHASEFSIQSAQAGYNEASDNLRRTTITAPMDGTVTALTKEMGENVLGNNMMSGDIIMKISALSSMEVNVEVNESDIVRVNLGDTAEVEVDAYEDVKFKGVVTEISNTALNALGGASMSVDQVTNFSVKIQIVRESYAHLCKDQPESYSPFRPGMSATVDIETEKLVDVLTIPIKAVTSREDTSSVSFSERMEKKKRESEGKPAESATKEKKDEPYICVFVLNDAGNEVSLRVIKTGIQDNQYVYIQEGLKEGEKVVTGPYELVSRQLKNKDKVEAGGEEGDKKTEEE